MKMKNMTSKTIHIGMAGLSASVLLLSLAVSCIPIQTQAETVSYYAQPGGAKVKIEGTSSIHDWNMESPVISGSVEADAGFPESALKGGAAAKPKVQVKIPVRSLKSYNKRMDEVYQEHMEEPKFKNMEFKLTELKAKGDAPKAGKCEFDAVGTMSIHGVSKEVTMPVTIEKTEVEKGGKKLAELKITGSTPLKMSDYTVKPPCPNIPGVGQITTGDEIKLTFEWSPRQR